jgi:phosphopantothenoylcysteine decarboxylase/phosphopantothenate--cysteine ligase
VQGKRILLIISGGIAAYKCLDLIRRLRERDVTVRCVLTRGGEQFVTPLTLSTLSGHAVHRELFSLTEESEIGHIELSREADLVLVAPATANILAKMAAGIGDDLATTLLLATSAPVMVAPAMNVRMWHHPATQANLALLTARGIRPVGPAEGPMACNEYGMGRMAEVGDILAAMEAFFGQSARLAGRRALVTSGPTFEPIDPVRYIANRSSGKQGHAIAAALAALGAETTLVSGPSHQPDPPGVTVVRVETAAEMLAACQATLPADIAVCAAAVADWRVAKPADSKIKKTAKGKAPALELAENPDILATLSAKKVVEQARAKRRRKGCDWIVANDVSAATGTFGGDGNRVHLITGEGAVDTEDWPPLPKREVAARLAARIADALENQS